MLIDELRSEKAWVISDKDKVPIYVQKYLETGNENAIWPCTRGDMANLSTFDDIKHAPKLANCFSAYRVHASSNLVIIFDVEPSTDKNTLYWFYSQPAHYKEFSWHYGIHLVYKLDRRRLSEKAVAMLSSRTEIKHTEDKLNYEVMMNNHFVSFTGRAISSGTVDEASPVPDWVYQQLEKEAETLSTQKIEAITVDSKQTDVSDFLYNSYIVDDQNQNSYISYLKDLTPEDVSKTDTSPSSYEYGIAIRLVGYLKRQIASIKEKDGLDVVIAKDLWKVDVSKISPSDIALAVERGLEDICPERDKWSQTRNHLPWLLYVAVNATEWIEASDKRDQERLNEKNKDVLDN